LPMASHGCKQWPCRPQSQAFHGEAQHGPQVAGHGDSCCAEQKRRQQWPCNSYATH
jgi:hypothetical protein